MLNLVVGMANRGGGVVDLECRTLESSPSAEDEELLNRFERVRTGSNVTETERSGRLVIHVHIDVCDAMGANAVNTVAEGLSQPIIEVTIQDDSNYNSAALFLF